MPNEKQVEKFIDQINAMHEILAIDRDLAVANYCLEMAMLELRFACAKKQVKVFDMPVCPESPVIGF